MTTRSNGREGMSSFKVNITSIGRAGNVHYVEPAGTCTFYWEFGGRNAIAVIIVPTPDEWDSKYPWAKGRRDEILRKVAEEVRTKQTPSGYVEITENAIYFKKK